MKIEFNYLSIMQQHKSRVVVAMILSVVTIASPRHHGGELRTAAADVHVPQSDAQTISVSQVAYLDYLLKKFCKDRRMSVEYLGTLGCDHKGDGKPFDDSTSLSWAITTGQERRSSQSSEIRSKSFIVLISSSKGIHGERCTIGSWQPIFIRAQASADASSDDKTTSWNRASPDAFITRFSSFAISEQLLSDHEWVQRRFEKSAIFRSR